VNIRAYFKMLYGIIPDKQNDCMFWWGLASLIALPFVGIFDEELWKTMHVVSAGTFFVGFMIYGWKLGDNLWTNRVKFPSEQQAAIQQTKNAVSMMVMLTFGFFLSGILHGSKGITAIMEWACVLYFVNFFSIASYANPFYSCVHQPKTA
jgi:Frag1/DRAM/Sfk1 family